MADLYQNNYRVASARLQIWDYANEGMYFVTICTKNREYYFGEIVETRCTASLPKPQMKLSEIGKIAQSEWVKSKELRPDLNLEFGEIVIIPNHMHGIVIIGENELNRRRDAMHRVSANNVVPQGDAMHLVSTASNRFGPQSKNLSSICAGYKSAVTTCAQKNNIEYQWQARFHDHIIRSVNEYYRISNYIINNVGKWRDDKFNNQTQCIGSLQKNS